MQDMREDNAPDSILTFLRRTGHQVDGYITQQIGPYQGNKNVLLIIYKNYYLLVNINHNYN